MTDKDNDKKVIGKVYDYKLFARLMRYARDYKLPFVLSVISVVSVAVFAAVRPVLLKTVIDDYIFSRNAEQLLVYVLLMFGVLIFEVLFQFLHSVAGDRRGYCS